MYVHQVHPAVFIPSILVGIALAVICIKNEHSDDATAKDDPSKVNLQYVMAVTFLALTGVGLLFYLLENRKSPQQLQLQLQQLQQLHQQQQFDPSWP